MTHHKCKLDPSFQQGLRMNNFTILNLNKGDSLLQNKVLQLNHLLTIHNPDIFSINKLNLEKDDTVTPYQFQNYTLEHDNLQKTDNTSQTGILIKNTVKYKRRKDLKTKGTAVVWIQVAQKGKKDILIQSIYRQFQRLNHPISGTLTHQYNRWKSIVDKWKAASLENRELITVGDLNINYLSWDLHPTQQTSQEKSQ